MKLTTARFGAFVKSLLGGVWKNSKPRRGRAQRRYSRDGFAHVENLEAREVMSATPMQVGINLDNVNDYTPNWMFTDAFQHSRQWISHSFNTVTQTQDFNGGAFIPVQTDANGWPTQLATWTNAHGHLMQQRLGTLMFRELDGKYPAGTYRVEWDGTGDVVFNFDARETSRGRTADGHNFALLNVTPGSGGIYLGINSMSSTDPIRDIHVWLPDYNGQSFAGQRWQPGANFSPFHPLYKERIDNFGILRFMQTQETVTSDIVSWSDRRDASDARQSSGGNGPMANGISVEHMVQLANELDADPWFNMPHMADDNFVRNFASYVRDNLEPGLTAYVEWSNEVWNYAPGFETYYWIADQTRLPENAGLTHWQIAGREAARDMNIWSDVFAGQTDRIVRTAGGFAVNPWITERIIENMGGSFDAIAIAPYFGPSDAQRASYSASTTVDQVLNDMRGNIAFSAQMTLNHQRLADDYSVRLGRDIQVVAYEGGPHLNGNNAAYQNALFQATKDPRMADITRDYLRMQNATGLDAYVHYKLTDRDRATQYGLFGVLLAQDQPTSEAHIYRALLDADAGTLFTSTPTLVTLNAADPTANEAGLGTASFRVTRGGDLSQPLTVNYSVNGNAIAGTDYNTLSGIVTFPANENTAFITVTPRDDATIESNEAVTVTLQPGAGYSLIGTDASTGSINIVSEDQVPNLSTINIVATDPNASEAARDPGVFTVTRTGGNTAAALTVWFQNGQQTAAGADYDSIPMNVTFAPGQTTSTITIRPVDDATVENRESVILYMNESTMYRLGASSAARIDISDNDVAPPPVTPLITVAATDADAGEAGTNPGTFTLTRTGALNNTLTVRYTASGTATGGFDFGALGGFAYFEWGQTTTTVVVNPYNDPTFEPVETVILNLTDGPSYDLGATSSATVNVTSDDAAPAQPTVTIVATDANAAERNRDVATFTVTRTGSSTGALQVNYSLNGSATNGSDFDALGGSVVIPAGQPSAMITVRPIDDTAIESNETVGLTLVTNAAYQLGAANSATATIVSDDVATAPPTVTISAVDASAAELNLDVAMFRVSRTGATTAPLTVNYTVGGTATNGADYNQLAGTIIVPAGASYATITVTPIDDTAVETAESIMVNLASNAAYQLGTTVSATATLVSNDVAPILPTVTIRATDPTAAEANRETGNFTVSRTGSATNPLVVNYSLSGTATNGSDFDSLSGSVTIPAGQFSAPIVLRPVDDTTVDPNETVTATLVANAAYQLGTSQAGTVTITDNDTPTQAPLPVLLVIANNDFYYQEYADPRTQFLAAGIPVVVGAGRRELSTPHPNSGQGSASGQVMPDIALADASATNYSAIVFVGGWGATQYQYAFSGVYNNPAYNGTPEIRAAANRLINEFVAQNKVIAGVCHGVSVLAWARVNGQSPLQGRTVTTAEFYSPANNLPDANSYRWHSETNGATVFTAGILGDVSTRNDDVMVDGRIITGENFDSARQFGITIADRLRNGATTTATIGATDGSAAETARETGTLSVTRTGSTTAALAVNYSLGGTATNGTDYDGLRGTVVIQPGQTTAPITVRPIDDAVVDANETVNATLAANPAYNLGSAVSASVLIADNDTAAPVLPTVTIAVTDAAAAEANRETGAFAVSRTGSTAAALVVNYSLSGSATNGSDIDNLSGSVTIPAGQSAATIVVRPVDDTLADANETVMLTLAANAAYQIGAAQSGTVTITDNDAPTQAPLPVLLVIANNDFYYQEYADPRAQFLAAGIPVVVGAGRRELSTPHPNSGQGSASGQVMPDIALADASATNYSAIVFVGGWGATQYQYAFSGVYNNPAYNGTPAIRASANRLINEFVAQNKVIAGVCHGVSVLAWARVNGQSPLQGRTVTTAEFYSPANNLPDANSYRWHSEANGATVFTAGVLGDVGTRNDDVLVDGRIITGENFDSARQFGITIAQRIRNGAETTATISATDASAAEASRVAGTLAVTRTGSTAAALAVNYSLGGTATNGADYDNLRGTVVIHPGQTTAAIVVRPVDDATVDPNETVVATLAANSSYLLGSATVGTVTIADNDVAVPVTPTVTIATTDSSAAEANRETGTFTVTRTGSTAAALTVNYTLSGTATNGSDYDSLTGSITIPAGQASATIVVRPTDDTAVDANESVIVTLAANTAYQLGATTVGTVTIADNDAPTQAPLPVLIVIPNNDFYYQEYADPRAQLEAAGIGVVVAAGRRELSSPHPNSGQGSLSGTVMPDLTLADANASNYSAIVFVGGWGASQYQYAFSGTYANAAYNSTTAIRARVNQLINDFVAQNKLVTALCHGVSVLAWARVNGQSLLQGRNVSVYNGASPPSNVAAAQSSRWHSDVNGATVFTNGQVGNPTTRTDDVIVDGRIITAENFDSARQFGITIANQVRAAAQ